MVNIYKLPYNHMNCMFLLLNLTERRPTRPSMRGNSKNKPKNKSIFTSNTSFQNSTFGSILWDRLRRIPVAFGARLHHKQLQQY